MTDIDKAKLDPTAVFRSPEDVLRQADLSREQKIDILRRWEYDARELEVAEEEGMPASQPDLLDRILQALHTLGAWHDPDHTAPTKQGGQGVGRHKVRTAGDQGMTRDAEIKHAVLGELAWDTRVEETEVGIEVAKGVVTLTGTVSSYAKKFAAQEAAHRVAGVRDVVNDIQVHVPGRLTRTDTDIAHMVRLMLEWNTLVPDAHIQTTVADGWVTLEGHVDVWVQRLEAERAIRHLAGIRGVTNRISVAASQVPPADARSQDIQRVLQEVLERRARHVARRITVAVSNGTVTLSGHVGSWLEKQVVIDAVGHVSGIEAVEDQLRIEPTA